MREVPQVIKEIRDHFGKRIFFLKQILIRIRLTINCFRLKKLPKFSEVKIVAKNEKIGFFAFLNWYLYFTKYLESRHFHPTIVLENSNYAKNRHNFDILFGRLRPQKKSQLTTKKITITVKDLRELVPVVGMNISEAISIQKRFLVPSERIQELVDTYIDTEIGGDFFAVHWRGTDKKSEAPPVNVQEIILKIEQIMSGDFATIKTCYIASDEESKVKDLKKAIEERFIDIKVVYRPDTLRSLNDIPIHLSGTKSNDQSSQMGDEALFECLTLSRATYLIKTASFLSAWSAIFNPALPIYFLNAPYIEKTWFPDFELILSQKSNYE